MKRAVVSDNKTDDVSTADDRFIPFPIFCRDMLQTPPYFKTRNGIERESDWHKQLTDFIKSEYKFNEIILDALNVYPNGTLYLQNQHNLSGDKEKYFIKNGKLNPYFESGNRVTHVSFAKFIDLMKENGIKYIGFTTECGASFGYPWKNIVSILKSDDNNIKQHLFDNLRVLLSLGINMWNSNYEGFRLNTIKIINIANNIFNINEYESDYVKAHVILFKELHNMGYQRLTCCPPWGMQAWYKIACDVYREMNNKKQIIDAFYIQTYARCDCKTWHDYILENENYKEMGLTYQQAKNYIIGIISCEKGKGVFELKDGNKASLKYFEQFMGENNRYLGGGGLWQLFTCYGGQHHPNGPNTFDYSQNWSNLYAKAIRQGYQK